MTEYKSREPILAVPRKTRPSAVLSTKGRNQMTLAEHQEYLSRTSFGRLTYDEAVKVHGQAEADKWFGRNTGESAWIDH